MPVPAALAATLRTLGRYRRMRILLTNDDGLHATGLLALRGSLARLGDVTVVAPERERSAAGRSVTLHKPLRLQQESLADGAPAWRTNGTPTDCVTLGYFELLDARCDLVVSGINHGPNLGWDVTYSGTVAAAMEGAVLGVPAFAISLATHDTVAGPAFGLAAEIAYDVAGRLAGRLAGSPLPSHVLLNVNVPHGVPARGVQVTHQGRREYINRITRRTDPFGRAYYWQAGTILDDDADEGSDVHAVANGFVSVTPLHFDLTATPALSIVRAWSLSLPAGSAPTA